VSGRIESGRADLVGGFGGRGQKGPPLWQTIDLAVLVSIREVSSRLLLALDRGF